MRQRFIFFLSITLSFSLLSGSAALAASKKSPFAVQGVYVRQQTAETKKRLDSLVSQSLEVGVNTFVVDLWTPNKRYKRAIDRVQKFGINYVPRITMFPEGGTAKQIRSRAYWEKKYKLVEYAMDLGAKDIQLDYIRYSSKTAPSPNNAVDVREVLRFFKKRIHARGSRLQIDVFGEAAHRPSLHIGQDMQLFAPEIDAVCPMVYPSHYKPYKERAKKPFETVFGSLTALKGQLGEHEVSVIAYIELFNHRFPMSVAERVKYIRAQLRAVKESGSNGWMAWSAGNYYDLLFEILRRFDDPSAEAT